MEGHGLEKFPNAGLLQSSAGRQWTGMSAEIRAHPAGELAPIQPAQMEITIALRGNDRSTVFRRGGGIAQQTRARSGTMWFCPIGVAEDDIRIDATIPEVLHIYLQRDQFAELSRETSAEVQPESIRYAADVGDELVRQIGLRVVRELQDETSTGTVLVDSLSHALVAHLGATYAGEAKLFAPARDNGRLDGVRLRRVLDYIEDNLDQDITVEHLARVACLSRFHFSRMFREASGVAPHRYISNSRLRLAKQLLADGRHSLVDIALTCRFSSQASFNKAFARETGMSPGKFRATAR